VVRLLLMASSAQLHPRDQRKVTMRLLRVVAKSLAPGYDLAHTENDSWRFYHSNLIGLSGREGSLAPELRKQYEGFLSEQAQTVRRHRGVRGGVSHRRQYK